LKILNLLDFSRSRDKRLQGSFLLSPKGKTLGTRLAPASFEPRRIIICRILINFFRSTLIQTIVRPGVYSTTYKRSCLEIKRSAPHALSGLYDILVDNTVITVYCEMAKEGGGFTFIPREAVRRGKFSSLIRQICKDRSRVLLRFQRKDGLQPFTLITQLPAYATQPLSVLMHTNAGYTRPLNYGLGDYIYLGILPAYRARAKTIQGFR
jgi:hypothetical protein